MSDHYYTQAGEPRHLVEKANGNGLRPTTLRDAKKELLVPSFSTINGIRNKYQLNRWITKKAIEASYGFNPAQFDGAEDYARAVMEFFDETAGDRTGSDEGSAIHAAIESLGKGQDCDPAYHAHARAALDHVRHLFPQVKDWRHEFTFANSMGFGGMVDMHSPSTGILVDFKTKDFLLDIDGNPTREDGRKYRLDYDQYIQLAAYQRGLGLPGNLAANVFVSRLDPGVVCHRVWDMDELAKGWDIFTLQFRLWTLVNDYDPSFMPEEEAA